MDTLFDYLNKYKNMTFKKLKFNEIDALIFSELAYLNFELLKNPIKTIKSLSKDEIEAITSKTALKENNFKFINILKESKRYSNVKILHHITKNNLNELVQFSAVSFVIGLRTIVISFRGTDGTVLGWKENLMMGCNKEVPAQKEAYNYFKHVKLLHGFSKFYIVGHSKGGNLADYTSLRAFKEIRKNRIIHTYNFDGPGFIDKELFKNRIPEKMSKYIPEESAVGILLDNESDKILIKSKGEKFGQHNIYNWYLDLETNKIELGTERTEFSNKIEYIITELFQRMDAEEIKDVIAIIESILGIKMDMHVNDINMRNPIILLWKFFRYNSISKEKKKKIREDLMYLYGIVKNKGGKHESKND